MRRRMLDTKVRHVNRLGKRVVIELDSHDRLVLHPRMSGLVLLADPPDWEHLRLHVRLAGRKARDLYYWDVRGLGTVDLLRAVEYERLCNGSQIGPDALELTPQLLRERLGQSRRPIKVALLDQTAVAGIGNLYASEILHATGLSPKRRCYLLRTPDWERLNTAIRQVLEAAIRYEGSTLADGTYRNAQNREGTYQSQHRVYGKAGEHCPRCHKGRIERIVQAQRSTFYCPVCQSGRRAGAAAKNSRTRAAVVA